ncbi:MAG: hypothetical protein PHN37_01160, partial [Candidatus Pacebacteria bacterium]|nr:hypothetical protein [Candidatus Paceibacterota bacterium]
IYNKCSFLKNPKEVIKMKLLIVENEFENRLRALQAFKLEDGFEVVLVDNKKDAEKAINDKKIQAALISLFIPEKEGQEPDIKYGKDFAATLDEKEISYVLLFSCGTKCLIYLDLLWFQRDMATTITLPRSTKECWEQALEILKIKERI